MRPFNSPDPDMKNMLIDCLVDIREWPHYDNYQHGHYVNENKMGYGKIKVYNANVHIITANQNPQPNDEKYKKIWGDYPTWHTYFRGDLSQRRFEYLLELSKRHECLIEVEQEFGRPAFKISEGEEKPFTFEGYHVNCGEEVCEDEISSKKYSCKVCGQLNFHQTMKDIARFKSEVDFVDFGEVCRRQLDTQCQYGMYLLYGLADRPIMGEGLRVKENDNWHQIKMHKDDVDEFVKRVKEWRGY